MASKMRPHEYELAKEIENLCALTILENPDVVDVQQPSSREDMYLHYDLIAVLTDDTTVKTDVKGLKSLGYGRKKTGDFHWIELKNVSGAKGWLYGHADVISFQVGDEEFIHVYRKDLVEYTEKVLSAMENKTPMRTDPYDFVERYVGKRIFTRDNPDLPSHIRRYDEIILVDTADLRKLATNPFKL